MAIAEAPSVFYLCNMGIRQARIVAAVYKQAFMMRLLTVLSSSLLIGPLTLLVNLGFLVMK